MTFQGRSMVSKCFDRFQESTRSIQGVSEAIKGSHRLFQGILETFEGISLLVQGVSEPYRSVP